MTVVILVAILSSLLRYYLPMADNYREILLEEINSRSQHVSIDAERIQSQWKPFKPGITFYGVSVKPEGMDQTIDLEKIHVEINIIESLLKQQLYFDYIEVANLDLLLLQAEDGSWNLSGYSADKEANKEERDIEKILERLWAIDELALHHIQLAVKPYQKERISFPNLMVNSVTMHGKKHVVAELIEGNQRLSQFVLHTSGMPTSPDFAAKAYVKTDNYQVLDLLSIFTEASDVKNGVMSNELWFEWNKQQLSVEGKLDIKNLEIQIENKQWDIQSITATVSSDYLNEKLAVAFPHIEVKVEEKILNIDRLSMTYKDELELQLAEANLSDVHQFLDVLPIADKLKNVLNELSPTGSLQNLYLKVDKDKQFTLQALLDNVSVDAWEGAPKLVFVNGFLYATKTDGYVELDTKDFTLGFPKLFNETLQFDLASGKFEWQLTEENIYISGKGLSFSADVGEAVAEFHLLLPKVKSEQEPPRLDLVVGLLDGDFIYRNKFLPHTLDEKLLDWLDGNIHEGDIDKVGFIYHGPTIKTDAEQKVIQLWLDVKNTRVSYLKDWPHIKAIAGDLLLDDKLVFAEILSAKAGEVDVVSASVDLFPVEKSRRINVAAKIDSTSESAIRFVQNKPLSQQMNNAIEGWVSPKGRVVADVAISSLITKSTEPPRVHIDANLKGVELAIPKHNVEVSKINGPVTFNLLKGLESDGVTARFWGQPVTTKILSLGKKDALRTSVRVQGHMDASSLAKWTQQPAVKFMEGIAPFSADLYFGALGAGLKVSSKLDGVAVNLPQPFYKKKEDRRLTLFSMPFSGESREMTIKYGEGVNVHFLMGDAGIEAGKINLGVKETKYQSKKILVGGQLLQADIEEWLGVISKYEAFQKDHDANGENEWTLLVDKLQIKTLTGYNQSLDTVSFDLFNTVSYWQLGLDHKDLNATLKIFDDDSPMQAHMHRVNMEFISSKQEESGIGMADPSLSELPDVDFTIDKLIRQGEDYGEWEFNLRSYDDNITLENIQSSVKSLRIGPVDNAQSTLMWTLGDNPETHFSGKFATDDLADALVAWGYEQEVHSEFARFDVSSFWQGVPTDFEFNKIKSNIRLMLKKGNFADAESSGTGALKVIGILNVSRLVRRLKLDFSDLTNEGLTFDTVTGDVDLDQGVFTFKNPIRIKSPSSEIRLSGGVNINTQEMDMDMGVTLPLANNLPWLALIGGPIAAVGTYVITKLMKEQMDKLSSVVYSVRGSFDDPVIKFVKLFDMNMKEEKVIFEEEIEIPEEEVETK